MKYVKSKKQGEGISTAVVIVGQVRLPRLGIPHGLARAKRSELAKHVEVTLSLGDRFQWQRYSSSSPRSVADTQRYNTFVKAEQQKGITGDR